MLTVDGGPDADLRELDHLTRQLRQRLLGLEVDAVELVRSDEIPSGAKPVDAVTIGALVVTLTPGILRTVVRLVEAWLQHRPAVRSVKMTIDGKSVELTNASRVEQRELVRIFIDEHAKR